MTTTVRNKDEVVNARFYLAHSRITGRLILLDASAVDREEILNLLNRGKIQEIEVFRLNGGETFFW